MEKLVRNIDSIIKWIGYLSVVIAAFSAVVLIGYMLFDNHWDKWQNVTYSFVWLASSFFSAVSSFATYTIVKAAKIYISKNEPENEEETTEEAQANEPNRVLTNGWA